MGVTSIRSLKYQLVENGSLAGHLGGCCTYRRSAVEMTGAAFDAGKTVVHWKRTCTLVGGLYRVRQSSLPPSVVFEGISVFDIADDLVVTCDDDWSGLTEALQQIPFGNESPTLKDAPAIVEGIDTVWIGGLALPRRQQPQRFR
jgi:hypothetical protein